MAINHLHSRQCPNVLLFGITRLRILREQIQNRLCTTPTRRIIVISRVECTKKQIRNRTNFWFRYSLCFHSFSQKVVVLGNVLWMILFKVKGRKKIRIRERDVTSNNSHCYESIFLCSRLDICLLTSIFFICIDRVC